MCLTGYWHVRNLDRAGVTALAEPVPDGPSTKKLVQLAKEHNIIAGTGLIERVNDDKLYNSYVVCDVDGAVHKHHKIHSFISPHVASGDAYTVFDTTLGYNVGVLTCYDNNIVENVHITGLMGDDMVVADLDMGLLPQCTGRRWRRGRKPELYGSLVEPAGIEVDPREARFTG
jgi:predicted amidohydrolase